MRPLLLVALLALAPAAVASVPTLQAQDYTGFNLAPPRCPLLGVATLPVGTVCFPAPADATEVAIRVVADDGTRMEAAFHVRDVWDSLGGVSGDLCGERTVTFPRQPTYLAVAVHEPLLAGAACSGGSGLGLTGTVEVAWS